MGHSSGSGRVPDASVGGALSAAQLLSARHSDWVLDTFVDGALETKHFAHKMRVYVYLLHLYVEVAQFISLKFMGVHVYMFCILGLNLCTFCRQALCFIP